MATNWAFHWCERCDHRLTSPGEIWCDRCDYDAEVEIDAMIRGDNAQ